METFLAIVFLAAVISRSLFGKSTISEIENWVKDDEDDKKTK